AGAGGRMQRAALTRPADPSAATPPLGAALVKEIKKELKRVGCYSGGLDERWPTAETTASLKKFAAQARLSTPGAEPSVALLEEIRGRSGRVCPLECGPRQGEKDGRCVAKACPSGSELDDGGDCRPKRKSTASRPDAEDNERPKARPREERPKTAARPAQPQQRSSAEPQQSRDTAAPPPKSTR